MAFSLLDWVALAFFVAAWIAYHVTVELTPAGGHSLNRVMNEHRRGWMERMLSRENRVVDTTIMASLQNGTAFFASTSLLAGQHALHPAAPVLVHDPVEAVPARRRELDRDMIGDPGRDEEGERDPVEEREGHGSSG